MTTARFTLADARSPLRGLAAFRCACGGWVTMGTENEYGRSVETCDGECGYRGPPRIATDVQAEVEKNTALVIKNQVSKQCQYCPKKYRGRGRTMCYTCAGKRRRGAA